MSDTMNKTDKGFRVFAVLVIAALLAVALVNLYQSKMAGTTAKTLSYSQFLDELDQNKVNSVTLVGQELRGLLSDHTLFKTYAPSDPDLIKLLRQKSVSISAKAPAGSEPWSLGANRG